MSGWMMIAAIAAPAAAADWEVGAGVRNSAVEDWDIEGARGIVRRSTGAWAIEGQAYWRPDTSSLPSLYHILVDIAGQQETMNTFQVEVEVDRATAALLGEWAFGEPEAPGDGGWLRGGPRLYAGAEARLQHLYTLSADSPQAVDPALRFVAGPVIGAGWRLDLGSRFAIRGAVYDRMRLARPANYDASAEPPGGLELRHHPTTAADLLVRF